MTRFNKGARLRIITATRTFEAKAAKSFSSDFDMIYPVYDMDRGGGAARTALDGSRLYKARGGRKMSKEKDLTRTTTAVFFKENGKYISGAIVEAFEVPDGWGFKVSKYKTGSDLERMRGTIPEDMQVLQSSSGRVELLISPFLVMPAGHLWQFVSGIEREFFARKKDGKPVLMVQPSKIRS